jgi:diaminohydroxyphosphoribosylaminopyrimidine deaminase/5-amino-6-(5-phosphoribosylamino)uracil reductase
MSKLKDVTFLEMAFALAEKARGWTSPNPYVGAVIEKDGLVVGWGYHEKSGKPHAEIIALDRAGLKAQGATAYITLEPCTHWGRTPPCVDRIVQSRLKRVVIADIDPNPKVNGRGLQKISQAGIQVSVGQMSDKNRKLNEAYTKYITQKIPFITLKAAVSLDGKIATRRMHSTWISSPAAREYMHLVRGEQDAILVGINTILKDDPLLTVRHPHWKNKRLARIILDSQLRIPLKAKIFDTFPQGDILIFTRKDLTSRKAQLLAKKGVTVLTLKGSSKGVDLRQSLDWLGKNEVSSILVEGGGQVFTSFLEKKLADKLLLSLSPKLIGGGSAPGWFQGRGVATVSESLAIKQSRCFKIGSDTIIEGYF